MASGLSSSLSLVASCQRSQLLPAKPQILRAETSLLGSVGADRGQRSMGRKRDELLNEQADRKAEFRHFLSELWRSVSGHESLHPAYKPLGSF